MMKNTTTNGSTMLSAFEYDAATQQLTVCFHNGGKYAYNDVPIDVYNQLKDAPSKGQYMREHVFNKFAFVKQP